MHSREKPGASLQNTGALLPTAPAATGLLLAPEQLVRPCKCSHASAAMQAHRREAHDGESKPDGSDAVGGPVCGVQVKGPVVHEACVTGMGPYASSSHTTKPSAPRRGGACAAMQARPCKRGHASAQDDSPRNSAMNRYCRSSEASRLGLRSQLRVLRSESTATCVVFQRSSACGVVSGDEVCWGSCSCTRKQELLHRTPAADQPRPPVTRPIFDPT